jgi:hypothetical protein
MSPDLQPRSEALLFMLETHMVAHSVAEGSAATIPKAAIRARATGEKDFMMKILRIDE